MINVKLSALSEIPNLTTSDLMYIISGGISYYVPIGDVLRNKNVFINGGFDIWQRGTSFTANGLTADRWKLALGVGAAITVSRSAFTLGQTDVPGEPEFYVSLNRTTAGSASSIFLQAIEDVRTFAGKTVTFSFWAKATAAFSIDVDHAQNFGTGGGSGQTNGANLGNWSVTTSWQKFSTQIPIASISGKTIGTGGNDFLAINFIWRNTQGLTETLDIANVQIEEGSVATDFESRPIGLEQALAQRYYQKSFPDSVVPAQNAGRTGAYELVQSVGPSLLVVFASVILPVQMRATPTVTLFNPSAANAEIRNVSAGTNWTGSVAVLKTEKSFSTNGTTPAGSDEADGGSFHWTADAEL